MDLHHLERKLDDVMAKQKAILQSFQMDRKLDAILAQQEAIIKLLEAGGMTAEDVRKLNERLNAHAAKIEGISIDPILPVT